MAGKSFVHVAHRAHPASRCNEYIAPRSWRAARNEVSVTAKVVD